MEKIYDLDTGHSMLVYGTFLGLYYVQTLEGWAMCLPADLCVRNSRILRQYKLFRDFLLR